MKHSTKISIAALTATFATAACGTIALYTNTAVAEPVEPITADSQNKTNGLGEDVGSAEQALMADCNGFLYDPDFSFCCGGMPVAKESGNACCGDSWVYDTNSQLCCGDKTWTKGHDNACCGKWPYDTSSWLCCGGSIWPKWSGTKCCGDFPCT